MSSMSTSESNASSTSSGIASGQNSSGKKLPRIRLIIDEQNVGHTFPPKSQKEISPMSTHKMNEITAFTKRKKICCMDRPLS